MTQEVTELKPSELSRFRITCPNCNVTLESDLDYGTKDLFHRNRCKLCDQSFFDANEHGQLSDSMQTLMPELKRAFEAMRKLEEIMDIRFAVVRESD